MRTLNCLARSIIVLAILGVNALANTPGVPQPHAVELSWTASPAAGVTYNLYRGTAAGVCSGTPTPYKTGITGLTFTDTANLTDNATIYYNVSAVKTGGAESACNGELRVLIPSSQVPQAPTGLKADTIQ